MKSFFRLTILFAGVAFLFSSCSKKNEEGKMIPKNAMFVVQLNTKSLKEKLSWDDIKQSYWYGQIYAQYQEKHGVPSSQIKKIFDNPENSGIDLNSSLIFFVAKTPGTNGEIVLEGSIKNPVDFGQFNKTMDSAGVIRKEGGLNMLSVYDKTVVAWDDKHFVYAFDAGDASSKFPSMNGMSNQSNVAPLVDKSVALASVCKNLFSLKSDSSLAENEKFTNLLKENGDIHGWVNSEEIMKSSSSLGMLGMLKLDVFFKDNIGTYTVNFDKGKIDIMHKGYAGKDFSDFLKKYSGGSINADMIKTIPSQNVLGILAMNYKPDAIKDLIKLTGMDGFLNMYAGQIGFSLDDFVKANKGDLLLAVSDFKMNPDTSHVSGDSLGNTTSAPVAKTKPYFNILFSVSIGDKPSFQKLVDAGKKIEGEMGRNDTTISYGQNDKVFAITNHQHFLNDYLAGNANNKYDFVDKLSGHSVGFYLDIHKMLSIFSTQKMDDPDHKTIMDESLNLWNNLYITTGDFKDNALTGNTEINFIDQNTNSLKQLNHYFDTIAKVLKAKKDKEKTETNTTDSLIVPPPIDTVGHK